MRRRFLLLAPLLAAAHLPLAAQPADTLPGARGPLVTSSDLRRAGIGAAATVLLMAIADKPIQRAIADDSTRRSPTLQRVAQRVAPLNEFRSFYISAGVYGLGTIARRNRVADIGLHAMEAIVISRLVTDVIGGTLGRGRPYAEGDDRPHVFKWGQGLRTHGYNSLPSRHVTGVSALATVVTREVAMSWPGNEKWVGPIAYGVSTLVGAGRVWTHHHWASDVAAGTVVGTLVGTAVTRFHHTHPNNGFDRVLLQRQVPGAPMIGFNFKF